MTIFEKRLQVTPLEYDWAKREYETSLQNSWAHTEVAMQSDLLDWNSTKITQNDRDSISGILRGFTVLEEVVGQHWANLANLFPKPEIMALCRNFSAQEWVHTYAYDLLETTLGISDVNWQNFQRDENALEKLETYTNYLLLDNIEEVEKIAEGLAIFGGCAEGVSLFGSFALLLSYTNKGLFPGMNQILSWSVRDEDHHSICAINLYHTLIKEFPTAKLKKSFIKKCFDTAIQLEINFITPAFIDGKLGSGVTIDDIIDFLHHRANKKLNELGFSKMYTERKNNSIKDWFYPLTSGVPINDFFIQRANGAAYSSKLTQDFTNISFDF